jgi:hypothetical protein
VLRVAWLYESIFFLEQKAVDLESQFEEPLGVLLLCCLATQLFPTFPFRPFIGGSSYP